MIFDNPEFLSYELKTKCLYFVHPISMDRYRMYPWESWCKVEKYISSIGWVEIKDIEWDLPLFSDEVEDGSPAACYLENIPDNVKNFIYNFPYDQINLLRICANSPRACQLAEQSPTLLWYISKELWQAFSSRDKLNEFLGKKKKELLQICRIKGENWIVNLLDRLGYPCINTTKAREILKSIIDCDNVIKILLYNKNLNWQILSLAYKYRLVFNIKATRSIFRTVIYGYEISNVLKYADQLLRDTERLGGLLEIENYKNIIYNCNSMKQLRQIHDKWTERHLIITRNQAVEKYNKKYPKPPVSGNEHIVPITEYTVLCSEGSEMHNCVASYIERILNGNCYIYKTHYPERATIEIVPTIGRDGQKVWRLGQIKTYCNKSVNQITLSYVRSWIKNECNNADNAYLL